MVVVQAHSSVTPVKSSLGSGYKQLQLDPASGPILGKSLAGYVEKNDSSRP